MCICCFKPLWPILFWLSVGAADNERFCEMHLQWNPSKGKIYKVTWMYAVHFHILMSFCLFKASLCFEVSLNCVPWGLFFFLSSFKVLSCKGDVIVEQHWQPQPSTWKTQRLHGWQCGTEPCKRILYSQFLGSPLPLLLCCHAAYTNS